MQMRNIRLVAVLTAITAVMPTYGMDLSLAAATQKIIAESQDLKKADANVKKAEAQVRAANANRWFKLDATATYMNMVNVENPSKSTGIDLPPAFGGLISESLKDQSVHIEIPDNIFMAGLSLSQPIYTFGKIGNAVKSVKSAVQMSKSSRELNLLDRQNDRRYCQNRPRRFTGRP